jgi:hypothetical protein
MKFSQIYLPPAKLVRDSARMRTRLNTYLRSNNYDTDALALRIGTEMGVKVPRAQDILMKPEWITEIFK